jgi:hypothetical protein
MGPQAWSGAPEAPEVPGGWQDNKFCSKYPGIRRGYETCYVFQKTGENSYSLFYADGGPEDGKLSGTWAVEK